MTSCMTAAFTSTLIQFVFSKLITLAEGTGVWYLFAQGTQRDVDVKSVSQNTGPNCFFYLVYHLVKGDSIQYTVDISPATMPLSSLTRRPTEVSQCIITSQV